MSNYAIYFSPTGGTEKVTKLLAGEIGKYESIDLSRKDLNGKLGFSEEDVCVIGLPSYGGRVPSAALERMKNFRGNSAKAVLIAVYGNRAYEDTLVELQDFLTERGFQTAAAVAAVAEHSIMRQFAKNRPDEKDKEELTLYARRIKDKLEKNEKLTKLNLPGNRPYKEYKVAAMKPETTADCVKCGKCADLCPVGAIPRDAPDTVDTAMCISCMRCVKICAMKARRLNETAVKALVSKLEKACEGRKNNELFI